MLFLYFLRFPFKLVAVRDLFESGDQARTSTTRSAPRVVCQLPGILAVAGHDPKLPVRLFTRKVENETAIRTELRLKTLCPSRALAGVHVDGFNPGCSRMVLISHGNGQSPGIGDRAEVYRNYTKRLGSNTGQEKPRPPG